MKTKEADKMFDRKIINHGAIDMRECANRGRGGNCLCKPRCARCGNGKHTAIHAPLFGQPQGTTPYGHEFI